MKKLFWFCCTLAVAFGIVSVTSPRWVASGARKVAGDAPFCIQVGTRETYKAVRTWSDLSVLTMRAPSGVSHHHAILIVGDETAPRLFHWSWSRRAFVAGLTNEQSYPPALACAPERGFLDRLPMLFARGGGVQYIRFSPREAYRIPLAYQPRWRGGLSPTLSLMVAAPDFELGRARWDDLSPEERDSNSVLIQWNPQWLKGLIGATPGGEVVRRDMMFGLRHRVVVLPGRESRRYESHDYLTDEASDTNITQIICGASTATMPKSCHHRFLHGGKYFYFRHRPEDVGRWQAMQRTVLNLLAELEAR
jgi:hypothetical protein